MNKILKIVKDNRILTDKVILCKSIGSKMRGLMFRGKLKNNEAMVFQNKEESIGNSSIHMLFVFFKIDVAWLDKHLTIVDLRENIMPFTPLIIPRKKAGYIIEFHNGKIKEERLKIGDKLKFI